MQGIHGISCRGRASKNTRLCFIETKKRVFTEVLLSIPNVGNALDFNREQEGSIENVFD